MMRKSLRVHLCKPFTCGSKNCSNLNTAGFGLLASYHLSLKTIKRSAGRSAMAAAAYRVGERIDCQRADRFHDYTRKQGIEETFILTPKSAPDWAQNRSKLWSEVETRRKYVTAREWELALPSVNERLKEVPNKPRENQEMEDARDQENGQEVDKERDIDRG